VTAFLLAHGARHTLIDKPGEIYPGINFGEIVERVKQPPADEKLAADFIIPSTYRQHDGRAHDVQRAHGQYRMLAVDVDEGSPSKDALIAAIRAACGQASIIIYSSSGASRKEKKWRALIPIKQTLTGDEYEDIQTALFDLLEAQGIICDHALARCGQPVFLPNVPPDKRDEAGKPLFYDHAIIRADTLNIVGSPLEQRLKERIAEEAEAQRQADLERLERQRQREERRKQRPLEADPIEDFNTRYSIAELFDRYGYERRGSSSHYRSRYQSTGSYATRDYGSHWVSLSGSDAAAGLGRPKSMGKASYTWGDAFDLFTHYEHGGDSKKAVRAYADEIRPTPAMTQPPVSHLDYLDAIPEASQRAQEAAGQPQATEMADGGEEALQALPGAPAPSAWPTVYDMFDASAIEPRRWIYGRHYLRSFVSVLASAGGIGKTSMQVVEALAIATGRPLLAEAVHEPAKVWLVNLEDPIEEMQRRVLAAMQHYGIDPEEVRGRLFLDAGRDFSLVLGVQTRDGVIPNEALVEYLSDRIPKLGIGCVMIDPFVAAHQVNENDNVAINAIVGKLRELADRSQCSIALVHHIRKGNGNDADIDSVRGAGSLIGAARAARVINKVSEDDAQKMGVSDDESRSLFRVDDGKANLAPPAHAAVYRKMVGVQIANGEWVGVCTAFEPPDAFEGISLKDARAVQYAVEEAQKSGKPFRENAQSPEWVGIKIAEITGIDISDKQGKGRVLSIIRTWKQNNVIRIEKVFDSRRNREIPIVVTGDLISANE
jgi:hypothetical protein